MLLLVEAPESLEGLPTLPDKDMLNSMFTAIFLPVEFGLVYFSSNILNSWGVFNQILCEMCYYYKEISLSSEQRTLFAPNNRQQRQTLYEHSKKMEYFKVQHKTYTYPDIFIIFFLNCKKNMKN